MPGAFGPLAHAPPAMRVGLRAPGTFLREFLREMLHIDQYKFHYINQ